MSIESRGRRGSGYILSLQVVLSTDKLRAETAHARGVELQPRGRSCCPSPWS